jgi:hypothetical protein
MGFAFVVCSLLFRGALPVIASEAKQSISPREGWIASSLRSSQ